MTGPDAPAAPWWEGRLAVLTLSATTDDPRTAHVTTAAVAYVGGHKATTAWGWIAEIPATVGAARRAHLDPAPKDHTEVLPAHVVAREVGHVVFSAWASGMPLVCCRAKSALTVLDREVRRHRIPDFLSDARDPFGAPGEFPVGGPVLDPVLLDEHFDPGRPGLRDFASLCAHYQTGVTAPSTVRVARLARRLAQAHPALRDVPVECLNDAQALWYRLRQQAFAARLREDGMVADSDDVCTAWPVRPYRAGDPL